MLSASELIKTQTFSSPENSNILKCVWVSKQNENTQANCYILFPNDSVWMCWAVQLQYHENIEPGTQLTLQHRRNITDYSVRMTENVSKQVKSGETWVSYKALGICFIHLSSSEHGAAPSRRGWFLQEQHRALKARFLVRIRVLMHWKTYDIWLITS